MGTRTDNVSDPVLAAELLLARRGQAFFSRKVNELRDEEFAAPSLVPGWSRAHVVAHVGYHARAIARLIEATAAGRQVPMYESPGQHANEVDFGATLPVEALRNLVAHAAVHLNVEWRDLPESAWSSAVLLADGSSVPASATAWLRAREVWLRALDLGNGAHLRDLPAEVRGRAASDLPSRP
ncbi:MAG: maleylpyruvate isomerase [Microbacterium sp.]|nr:maleylpyruvate isomerase [Microbacterium sp.]